MILTLADLFLVTDFPFMLVLELINCGYWSHDETYAIFISTTPPFEA